ncbi:ATP-binding protein [Peptoniphilus equinus]|uniref:ATP-binding protein n=1 Tax=Peptoniphilus equinus TaxID=3016343 RepID=A0ABY7QSL7_9FIRM|nr:ATP-binding protein [Peptoniphilus equinus]WBW49321.1 ATP-binding protein [Peptoniphilus equinus]
MNQIQKKQQKKLSQVINRSKKMKKEFTKNSATYRPNKKRLGFLNFLKKENNDIHTAQDTIPYQNMFKDGICQVTDRYFTKTVKFEDINYRLAQQEDQRRIFESYCEFLNYFDPSINFQFTFLNQTGYADTMIDSINIESRHDDFEDIRQEYSGMLKNQLAKGNNGLIKNKYITFGIEADSLKVAIPRLERIESDILNNFKILGVRARSLSGSERLNLIHSITHMDTKEKTVFDWDMVKKGGMTTKDFIAPTSFNFKNSKYFKMGSTYGAVSFLLLVSPELSDSMLAEILDIEDDIIVSFHIKSMDQREAIKNVKRKLTDLDKMKIEEQKKAVRSGYDMDIIPSDLANFGEEAKTLLNELQGRNERFFIVSFQITNFASKRQKLENIAFQISGIIQKYNCSMRRMDYQQEQGFVSSLPLALNQVDLDRGLTTSCVAINVPFTTQELFDPGGLYYGLNAISNNMIMIDRNKLKNPNGLILGTPGSGKSFSAKREMTNAFLITNDDIIICDPEAEYYPLVKTLNGQVVKVSPTSKDHINPLDINLNYADGDDPIMLKAQFVISLLELVVGGTQGLQPVELTIIDRCTRAIYQRYIQNPIPENIPILQDLYNELLNQDEQEAHRIATALEIYVTGSLKVFNNPTNVDINNRIVCYDIKELGNQLKKLGMLIIQDQVWNRVSMNRNQSKKTRFYIDECHLLLKEKQTAEYFVEIWKRFRKWGGIPTGLTQNVKDLLLSKEITNIMENSDFVYMLNQASDDRDILAKRLNISKDQLSYVTNSGEGEGLLYFGNVIVPFIDKFPKDTKLYNLMTTKPEEIRRRDAIKQNTSL